MLIQKNRTDRAIKIHETDTQGESRSPILAAFQNIPRNLSRVLSRIRMTQKMCEHESLPRFVSVQDTWHESMHICTCAYHEEYHN
jgi:hypothetical protein